MDLSTLPHVQRAERVQLSVQPSAHRDRHDHGWFVMPGWVGRAVVAALDVWQAVKERKRRRAKEREAETRDDLQAILAMADAIERGDLTAQARIARSRKKK